MLSILLLLNVNMSAFCNKLGAIFHFVSIRCMRTKYSVCVVHVKTLIGIN